MEYLSHVVLYMAFMRNYESIKKLCDILIKWGIDPITLIKAIGIFIMLIIVILIIVAFPIILPILLTLLISALLIGLIYTLIE